LAYGAGISCCQSAKATRYVQILLGLCTWRYTHAGAAHVCVWVRREHTALMATRAVREVGFGLARQTGLRRDLHIGCLDETEMVMHRTPPAQCG
jgi:hypothetical protein